MRDKRVDTLFPQMASRLFFKILGQKDKRKTIRIVISQGQRLKDQLIRDNNNKIIRTL